MDDKDNRICLYFTSAGPFFQTIPVSLPLYYINTALQLFTIQMNDLNYLNGHNIFETHISEMPGIHTYYIYHFTEFNLLLNRSVTWSDWYEITCI